jgi:hypothetical protein
LASAQQDLLHVLAREHRDHSIMFHELIDHLDAVAPRHRRRQYRALVLNLAVHLAAESLLVHPLVVAASATGEDTRRAREREMRSLHTRLTEAGAALDEPDRLRQALLTASGEAASHADREELEVFFYARHVAEPKELRRLGRLHATLHQRLPTRYQREGRAPGEPWTDERLPEIIGTWYAESLPGGPPDPSSTARESPTGERPDENESSDPRPVDAMRNQDTRR